MESDAMGLAGYPMEIPELVLDYPESDGTRS